MRFIVIIKISFIVASITTFPELPLKTINALREILGGLIKN